MAQLDESPTSLNVADLATVVEELPAEPFGHRADRLKPPALPLRRPTALGFIAIAASLASFWYFIRSLDAVVYVWSDAMGPGRTEHPSATVWDYITGSQWTEGLVFWPIYLLGAISVWLAEVSTLPTAQVAIWLGRVLLTLACILAVAGRVLSELASGMAWAGPEYKEGPELVVRGDVSHAVGHLAGGLVFPRAFN